MLAGVDASQLEDDMATVRVSLIFHRAMIGLTAVVMVTSEVCAAIMRPASTSVIIPPHPTALCSVGFVANNVPFLSLNFSFLSLGFLQTWYWTTFLAPTGSVIVKMVYYMYIRSSGSSNFSDFHSVYQCNWCYKCHSQVSFVKFLLTKNSSKLPSKRARGQWSSFLWPMHYGLSSVEKW